MYQCIFDLSVSIFWRVFQYVTPSYSSNIQLLYSQISDVDIIVNIGKMGKESRLEEAIVSSLELLFNSWIQQCQGVWWLQQLRGVLQASSVDRPEKCWPFHNVQNKLSHSGVNPKVKGAETQKPWLNARWMWRSLGGDVDAFLKLKRQIWWNPS
jgi:hypothetical protein